MCLDGNIEKPLCWRDRAIVRGDCVEHNQEQITALLQFFAKTWRQARFVSVARHDLFHITRAIQCNLNLFMLHICSVHKSSPNHQQGTREMPQLRCFPFQFWEMMFGLGWIAEHRKDYMPVATRGVKRVVCLLQLSPEAFQIVCCCA